MNVLVLGCGAVGSSIIRLLLKEKFINEILCVAKDKKTAKDFLLQNFKDIEFKVADALDFSEIKNLLQKSDFVINALPSYLEVAGKNILVNLKILEFCLKVGVNYLDFACYGDEKRKIAEQLLMAKKFEKEKLFALINAGICPGLSNLLAKESSEEFEYLESIKIRTLEDQRGLEFVLPWSKEGLFDVASKVLVYRNYKFFFKEPFTERENYDYPSFGKISCYLLSHDEVYTLPHFIKVRNVDVKGGGSDIEILFALYKLGILEDEKVRVGKFRISPKKFVYSIVKGTPTTKEFVKIIESGIIEDAFFGLFVDCKGYRKNNRILVRNYVTFSQKMINKKLYGTNYISYPTALSSVIFLKSVHKRRLYGVLPPEALPKAARKKFLNELERKDIILNEEYKKL
ncbi:MAG: saccharopine dehydrogenase NADP-binding domain-containing protein [Candidatus Aenigmatarchaeota archaeon]